MSKRTVTTPGPRDEKGVLAARILGVARHAFAENGWAGTTIRGVARTAGVDPALVYHYFKSKDALLDACTTLPPGFAASLSEQWADSGGSHADRHAAYGVTVVRGMLASWRDDHLRPVLQAILLIAAHEQRTLEKLTAEVTNLLLGPAVGARKERQRLTRSGLIASQLIGFAFMRYIWRIEPLASISDDEVVAALAPTVQHYADGDIQPAGRGRKPRALVEAAG